MTKVMVVGGYGGFGARLSRRLAVLGFDVVVTGRSLARAKAFCEQNDGCRPLAADRNQGLSRFLSAERPDLVIDASGPFQAADYRLVEECIAAGVSYADLADARQFVTGITQFDAAARRAGVTIASGTSSVPALSGAVVRRLSEDLDHVSAVEIAITASSRASVGLSVAQAIIGTVGQPMMLWRGKRWTKGYGWQELRRERIAVRGGQPLASRLVALADVPDLALLPESLPGHPAVIFRGGTESRLAVLALWFASWPVRWGWVRSLSPASGILAKAGRLTALWGGDRSGMIVRLFGMTGSKRVERRWSLIAEAGDGPEIPTLPAVLLAQRIRGGELAPAAYTSDGLFDLEDFEPLFESLAVRHQIEEIPQPPALYRRIMGDGFDRLPRAVRAMHEVLRDQGAHGRAQVERGSHPLAQLIARMMGFPQAGDQALHVHFSEAEGRERWTRDFGGTPFSSTLSKVREELVEQFGPLRFHFTLVAEQGRLEMRHKRWSLLGLPLPRALGPRSMAREWEERGRFRFDVAIALPLIGPLIRYRGWLELSEESTATTGDQNGTSSSRSVSKAAG